MKHLASFCKLVTAVVGQVMGQEIFFVPYHLQDCPVKLTEVCE